MQPRRTVGQRSVPLLLQGGEYEAPTEVGGKRRDRVKRVRWK
jgi:hypothetical protein